MDKSRDDSNDVTLAVLEYSDWIYRAACEHSNMDPRLGQRMGCSFGIGWAAMQVLFTKFNTLFDVLLLVYLSDDHVMVLSISAPRYVCVEFLNGNSIASFYSLP